MESEKGKSLSPLEKLIAWYGAENVSLVIDPQTHQIQDIRIGIRPQGSGGAGEGESSPPQGE